MCCCAKLILVTDELNFALWAFFNKRIDAFIIRDINSTFEELTQALKEKFFNKNEELVIIFNYEYDITIKEAESLLFEDNIFEVLIGECNLKNISIPLTA